MQNKKPIYQIIERDLRVAILKGEFKQGDLVPSETELAAKYKVSRMTVRQAINNLLIDGFIYRHKGRGTFVTFNKTEMEKNSHYFNFVNEPILNGIDGPIKTSVLKFEESNADEIIAPRLQLKVGDPVYYIERLKKASNIRLAYERLYLPKNMYHQLKEEIFAQSFYKYIENELGWVIKNCSISIEARSLTRKVADLLGQQEGEPTLYTSNVTYLDNGRAFEYTRCYFNAQYFRFRYNSPRNNNS